MIVPIVGFTLLVGSWVLLFALVRKVAKTRDDHQRSMQ